MRHEANRWRTHPAGSAHTRHPHPWQRMRRWVLIPRCAKIKKFLRSFCLAAPQQLLFPLPTQALLPRRRRRRRQPLLLCLHFSFSPLSFFLFYPHERLRQSNARSPWTEREGENNSCATAVVTCFRGLLAGITARQTNTAQSGSPVIPQ